jgi:DNA mismatch repair protein MutS
MAAAPSAPSEDPKLAALLAALDGLDPDAMSPREALDRLYQLKRLAPA